MTVESCMFCVTCRAGVGCDTSCWCGCHGNNCHGKPEHVTNWCWHYSTWCQWARMPQHARCGQSHLYKMLLHSGVIQGHIPFHSFIHSASVQWSTEYNKTTARQCPSVLRHCWLGDRKGIRPIIKLGVGSLVVMIWLELCMSYSYSCHQHLRHP